MKHLDRINGGRYVPSGSAHGGCHPRVGTPCQPGGAGFNVPAAFLMIMSVLVAAPPAQAQPQPIVCQVEAPAGYDAPVLRMDCDVLGPRAAYTIDAHDQAHQQVARLDAMLDEALVQRDRLRETLQAERAAALIGIEDAEAELALAHLLLSQIEEPPSRATWAAIGAAAAAGAAFTITMLITETP